MQYVRGHNRRKHDRWVEADTGFETPCWLWQLAKNHKGYGVVAHDGSVKLAHRASWEEQHGPIPAGQQLDHLCRVRACVRADHLEIVSPAENCRRGLGTKLSPEAVEEIRTSSATQHVLARRFGVGQPQISRIKGGKSWR